MCGKQHSQKLSLVSINIPFQREKEAGFFWQELCEAPAHRPSTILSVQRGENQSVRFDDVIFSTFP